MKELTEQEKVDNWNKTHKVGEEFMWRSTCGKCELFPVVTTGAAFSNLNDEATVPARVLFSGKDHYIKLDQLKPKEGGESE